ncbi:MAG: hypothetical protein KDD62_10075, partial [Bdellovibrionales bacterium]|nr:hypothetical protein [Bdellovibrionales bacterium]
LLATKRPFFDSPEKRDRYETKLIAKAELFALRERRGELQIQHTENQIDFTLARPHCPDVSFTAYYLARYLTRMSHGHFGSLGGLAPLAFPLPVWLSADPQIDQNVKKTISNFKQPDRNKFSDRFTNSTDTIAPGFDAVRFEDLERTLERKALLEIEFPRIQFALTTKPVIVKQIVKRLRVDLNCTVHSSAE